MGQCPSLSARATPIMQSPLTNIDAGPDPNYVPPPKLYGKVHFFFVYQHHLNTHRVMMLHIFSSRNNKAARHFCCSFHNFRSDPAHAPWFVTLSHWNRAIFRCDMISLFSIISQPHSCVFVFHSQSNPTSIPPASKSMTFISSVCLDPNKASGNLWDHVAKQRWN
jgi:hypothetical protein